MNIDGRKERRGIIETWKESTAVEPVCLGAETRELNAGQLTIAGGMDEFSGNLRGVASMFPKPNNLPYKGGYQVVASTVTHLDGRPSQHGKMLVGATLAHFTPSAWEGAQRKIDPKKRGQRTQANSIHSQGLSNQTNALTGGKGDSILIRCGRNDPNDPDSPLSIEGRRYGSHPDQKHHLEIGNSAIATESAKIVDFGTVELSDGTFHPHSLGAYCTTVTELPKKWAEGGSYGAQNMRSFLASTPWVPDDMAPQPQWGDRLWEFVRNAVLHLTDGDAAEADRILKHEEFTVFAVWPLDQRVKVVKSPDTGVEEIAWTDERGRLCTLDEHFREIILPAGSALVRHSGIQRPHVHWKSQDKWVDGTAPCKWDERVAKGELKQMTFANGVGSGKHVLNSEDCQLEGAWLQVAGDRSGGLQWVQDSGQTINRLEEIGASNVINSPRVSAAREGWEKCFQKMEQNGALQILRGLDFVNMIKQLVEPLGKAFSEADSAKIQAIKDMGLVYYSRDGRGQAEKTGDKDLLIGLIVGKKTVFRVVFNTTPQLNFNKSMVEGSHDVICDAVFVAFKGCLDHVHKFLKDWSDANANAVAKAAADKRAAEAAAAKAKKDKAEDEKKAAEAKIVVDKKKDNDGKYKRQLKNGVSFMKCEGALKDTHVRMRGNAPGSSGIVLLKEYPLEPTQKALRRRAFRPDVGPSAGKRCGFVDGKTGDLCKSEVEVCESDEEPDDDDDTVNISDENLPHSVGRALKRKPASGGDKVSVEDGMFVRSFAVGPNTVRVACLASEPAERIASFNNGDDDVMLAKAAPAIVLSQMQMNPFMSTTFSTLFQWGAKESTVTKYGLRVVVVVSNSKERFPHPTSVAPVNRGGDATSCCERGVTVYYNVGMLEERVPAFLIGTADGTHWLHSKFTKEIVAEYLDTAIGKASGHAKQFRQGYEAVFYSQLMVRKNSEGKRVLARPPDTNRKSQPCSEDDQSPRKKAKSPATQQGSSSSDNA